MALPSARDDHLSATQPSADALPLLRDGGHEMEEMSTRAPHSTNTQGRSSNTSEIGVEARASTAAKTDSLLTPHAKPAYWAPVSLNFLYLASLAALSTFLAICCFALVATSRRNNGIADAGSTGEFSFMKRFLPTLVAVLYTLTWTPVAADVIRTEPWALLSRLVGSKARDSLLKKDRMWWNHVADATRSKREVGGVRWPLLISILASLTASVVINPLSAGLFDTARISTTDDVEFLGADLSSLNTQPLRITDAIYLRAAVNLLFNVSTSAWNTDELSMAPFWPATSTPPFSATLASSPGIWTGTQDVVKAEVSCEPFSSIRNATDPYAGTVWTDLPFLQTESGCGVIFPSSEYCGGGLWAHISNSTSQETYKTCTDQGFDEYFLFCSREATPNALSRVTSYTEMHFSGQVCRTEYLKARIPVTVANDVEISKASVDTESFRNAQQPMDDHIFNMASFESEFISQTGATHLRPTLGGGFNLSNSDQNSNFKGPSLVLAASQNYSIERLIQVDPAELAKQAGIIKQRFMGEVFLSLFKEAIDRNATRPMSGSIRQELSRLVVDTGVGAAMGVVFVLLASAAISLAFLVRPHQRPLHIYTDPNESSTIAFALKETTTSTCFNDTDRATTIELESTLKDGTFVVEDGKLVQLDSETISVKTSMKDQQAAYEKGRKSPSAQKTSSTLVDWRPFSLRRKAGALLCVTLACVVAALASIYAVSKDRPLYQSAFTYSSEINFGKLNVTTLAPYSIIPTLIAVGIKLWWSNIDSAHRRLAPFLAMADASRAKPLRSPTTSYITTPILWITLLAIRRRHWLLAIVTFGALISEVLQISMAALWTRELGVLHYKVELQEQYQLRTLPQVFSDERPLIRAATNIAHPKIAEHLYGGELFQTSWMYGSLAELSFGAQPPAWSKDGWNFPPVDLGDVSKSMPNLPKSGATDLSRSFNVSMISQGLRGRIECSVIDDEPRWINKMTNLTALRPYRTTLNTTGAKLRSGFEFSSHVRVVNFTAYNGSQPTIVNLGQWLHFNYSSNDTEGDPLYRSSSSPRFTVLWTNASYPHLYEDDREDMYSHIYDPPPRLVFAERPQVQALECQPLFETSKARINVNADSGKIYDVQLLEDVQPAQDAWSNKFERHFSNETAYYDLSYSSDMNTVAKFNTTVSWGYLFQLAVLQACNVQGFVSATGDRLREGIAGPTPFSFIETDLYSDPYSYASLALVDYDRQALLSATTLTNVTQSVFSTFFQWFVSSRSGFTDDYWAYQPVGASLPSDLDFGSTESTVVSTEIGTRAETLCASSMSTYVRSYEDGMRTFSVAKCAQPTLTSYSTWSRIDTYVTITRSTSTSSTATARANSTTGRSSLATITSTASLDRRAIATDTLNNNLISADVSVHTETLVISPAALFLSIAILALLIIFTAIIYVVQRAQLSLLPRDFDCPASILAAVYASEKLKAWSEQQHKRRSRAVGDNEWKTKRTNKLDNEVAAKLGYFKDANGKEHWGIEIQGDDVLPTAATGPEFHDVDLQDQTAEQGPSDEATATESTTLVQQAETDNHTRTTGSLPRRDSR